MKQNYTTDMTAEEKDKIILKINALLAKNTDNGATEHEAITAMRVASSLMTKYFISEFDLKDPFVGKKCKMVEVPLIKTGYYTRLFYNDLVRLFDCKYFYNSRRITFYGFEQDAELCAYFYKLITRTVLKEKELYMKSPDYQYAKKYNHGRTVVSSFIKGFLYRVADKMEEMYKDKKSNIPQSHSLMIVEKTKKVEEQFVLLDLKITTQSMKKSILVDEAFKAGEERGEEFQLTQGIADHNIDAVLKLN